MIDLQLPADVGDQLLGPVQVPGVDHDPMTFRDREMGRPPAPIGLEDRSRNPCPFEILANSDRLGDIGHTGQFNQGLILTCHRFIMVIEIAPWNIKPLFPDL